MIVELKKKMFMNFLKMCLAFLGGKMMLMLVCYPSQLMKDASENIGLACYCSSWYEFKPKVKSLLFLMMVRTLRPCCLMACRGVPVNFSTVTFVEKTTMSYITALLSIQS
ncbi:odorant receptor 67a-like [Trichogramma pretiosum]|uniref:odorant receptor 67a-like n=1 Tax=Trichogramma pretiosum TaxID=7493 RepID=UPI0006C95B25|nr:odorant receptor 67a-like [Trichogramma pretiosum]